MTHFGPAAESWKRENAEDAGRFDPKLEVLEQQAARQAAALQNNCATCGHSKWHHLTTNYCRQHIGPDYCTCDAFVKRDMTLTTLNVRGIERETVERIKRAAAARDILIGDYLGRLVRLHDELRTIDGNGHGADATYIANLLRRVELETVTT